MFRNSAELGKDRCRAMGWKESRLHWLEYMEVQPGRERKNRGIQRGGGNVCYIMYSQMRKSWVSLQTDTEVRVTVRELTGGY